jgi:hypothetical protein
MNSCAMVSGNLAGMHQHALFARRRVVDEPGFLEFKPGFGVEVVEFVWARHVLFKKAFGNFFCNITFEKGYPKIRVWIGVRRSTPLFSDLF